MNYAVNYYWRYHYLSWNPYGEQERLMTKIERSAFTDSLSFRHIRKEKKYVNKIITGIDCKRNP